MTSNYTAQLIVMTSATRDIGAVVILIDKHGKPVSQQHWATLRAKRQWTLDRAVRTANRLAREAGEDYPDCDKFHLVETGEQQLKYESTVST